jgi:type II secretion system protein N
MKKKISKGLALYTLVTLIALVFFLYVRFPDQAVRSYLLDTMTERYPAASLSLASVSPSFPPGLKMANVLLSFKDNQADVRLESLRVRPRLTGYLVGHSSFAMNAVAYGGVMHGRVNFPNLLPDKIPTSAEIKLENLNLEKIACLKERLGRQIGGKLSGVYTYRGSDSQFDFNVQNGTYQLVEKISGFDRIDFSRAEGQITLKGGLLKINKLKLTGDKINLSLKGDIVLNSDFKNSEISLTGTMELAAMNNKKMPLTITGTIGNAKTKYL